MDIGYEGKRDVEDKTFSLSNLEGWRYYLLRWGKLISQVVLMVKNPPANAGDIRDAGSAPGSGRQERLLKEGMATHSSILALRIPWMEESGWL